MGVYSSEKTLVQELRSKRGDGRGRLFKMGLFSRGYGSTVHEPFPTYNKTKQCLDATLTYSSSNLETIKYCGCEYCGCEPEYQIPNSSLVVLNK